MDYTGKKLARGIFWQTKCMQYYYSGWKAYCADCGEAIEEYNIYMSREAAARYSTWIWATKENR